MTDPAPLGAGNPHIRDAAKLQQKTHRRKTGRLLIEGVRLVTDALAAGAPVREVFCSRALDGTARCSLAAAGAPVTVITEAASQKLSDTRCPQGVFAVVDHAPPGLDDVVLGIDALVLVCDGIADPGNLGTMIRSAAASGADCVVATGRSCDVTNPKTVRATAGALFRLPVVTGPTLPRTLEALRARGLRLAAAIARGGRPPWEVDLDRPVALVVGSEAKGLPDDAVGLCDDRLTIPRHRGTESLNAAACAAALLYEAARQRHLGTPSH